MTATFTIMDNKGEIIESKNKTFCSCCGEDVSEDIRGYWCSESFKNHTTNEKAMYLVLCVPCFKRTFNY